MSYTNVEVYDMLSSSSCMSYRRPYINVEVYDMLSSSSCMSYRRPYIKMSQRRILMLTERYYNYP
jgi:hypothetical protein